MPRDNICIQCHNAYHDDQMEADRMTCVYCGLGVGSDVGEPREPTDDTLTDKDISGD